MSLPEMVSRVRRAILPVPRGAGTVVPRRPALEDNPAAYATGLRGRWGLGSEAGSRIQDKPNPHFNRLILPGKGSSFRMLAASCSSSQRSSPSFLNRIRPPTRICGIFPTLTSSVFQDNHFRLALHQTEQPRDSWRGLIFSGAPGGTRTPGTRFRKPLLYPPELRARGYL